MNDEQDGVPRMSGWRVDKRIPIWGIIIGVGQGIIWGAIMYFTLYSSQMNLDKRVSLIEAGMTNIGANTVSNEKFAHVDIRLENLQSAMTDMKSDIKDLKTDVSRAVMRGGR
jgi:hypothetical protein